MGTEWNHLTEVITMGTTTEIRHKLGEKSVLLRAMLQLVETLRRHHISCSESQSVLERTVTLRLALDPCQSEHLYSLCWHNVVGLENDICLSLVLICVYSYTWRRSNEDVRCSKLLYRYEHTKYQMVLCKARAGLMVWTVSCTTFTILSTIFWHGLETVITSFVSFSSHYI